MHRASNLRDVVLARAENDFRLFASRHAPQLLQELEAVQDGHVPVDEERVGHLERTGRESFAAVGGFRGSQSHALENAPSYFSNNGRVVHNENLFQLGLLGCIEG